MAGNRRSDEGHVPALPNRRFHHHPDPSLAEEKPAPPAAQLEDSLVHWTKERGRLQGRVAMAKSAVDRAERNLKRAALLLAERVDKFKSAETALREYTEKGASGPLSSTESAGQPVPVPEEGSDAATSQRGSQGLQNFNVTFEGLNLTKFISDLSIPRPYLGTEQYKLCGCDACGGPGSFLQYKPGPF